MFGFFLEQTVFLSALSAFVLALFWPHVKPIVFQVINQFSVFHNNHENKDASSKRQLLRNPPKFTGSTLRKRTSSGRDSIRSTYQTLRGYGQSPSFGVSNPSFFIGQQQSKQTSSQQNVPPSSFFSLFSACVIGLVVYTLIKMFTTKLKPTYNKTSSRQQATYRTTKDLLSADRRKLMRMNKEERVNYLIKHHGGRNVSSAIKFLVREMEKQKQILCENLLLESQGGSYINPKENSYPCPHCLHNTNHLSVKKKIIDKHQQSGGIHEKQTGNQFVSQDSDTDYESAIDSD